MRCVALRGDNLAGELAGALFTLNEAARPAKPGLAQPEEVVMTLPSLFLSHGAPTLPLTDTPARAFLQQLGATLARPKAILVVSAHWETAAPDGQRGRSQRHHP